MVFDVLLSSSFLLLGIKGADRNELNKIASEPTAEHVLYIEDFHLLHNVAPKLSRRLCFTASEPPRPIKQTVQGASGLSLYPAFHLLELAPSQSLDVPATPRRWTSRIPSVHHEGAFRGWMTLEEQPAHGASVAWGQWSSVFHLCLHLRGLAGDTRS